MELSKTKAQQYASLKTGKMRRKYGEFIVEGEKGVSDTLGHYRLKALICLKGYRRDGASAMADDTLVFETTPEVMSRISTMSTPPALMAVYALPEEDNESFENLPPALYLILDGVRDPGNMGTIIRTAHWYGIKKIFCSRDCVDIYNPKTIQSSMGSLPHVDVYYCDPGDVVASNPELPVYGLLLDGSDIYKAALRKEGFIVMGNEGKGLSDKMRRLVTDALLLPPYSPDDHGESLNVAVATAVTVAEFRRRSMEA